MTSGTVKWFNKTKGFGFIVPHEGGEDVFVHVTVLEKSGVRYLDEGQAVSFETEIKNGRLRAVLVELNDNDLEDSDEQTTTESDEESQENRDSNEQAA